MFAHTIKTPTLLRLMRHIPILGGMLREVGRDPHRALPLFCLNVGLFMALMIWLFGIAAAAVYAFVMVPVMFVFLYLVGSN
ncbi:hypothetical protein [Woodsholea maritima]|uniref:hypothetical protein n=1 Tax=Woodsholea maritima TaxID=240237 RepID=UPI0003701ABA|nr:hypothetical protein [Woodsholea maritima]